MTDVYLVTTGDGSDGDEWGLHDIFATKEAADSYAAEISKTANSFPDVSSWEVKGSFLTDEERVAIYRAEARLRAAYVPDDETAATLRHLLARLA